MARHYRFRRRLRHYLRRAAFASYTRVFRNAPSYRRLSLKRRGYGWTTARHSKGIGLIRLYSRSRKLTGAEIKYESPDVAISWDSTKTYGHSTWIPLFNSTFVSENLGHKIRIVYISIHGLIPITQPLRVFLLLWRDRTEATLSESPFTAIDSPLCVTQSDGVEVGIPFQGFYSSGCSGNIKVLYDKVYLPNDSIQQRYIRLNFARGYEMSFTDGQRARGRNRWQLAFIYSSAPSSTTPFPTLYSRVAYTNVGG